MNCKSNVSAPPSALLSVYEVLGRLSSSQSWGWVMTTKSKGSKFWSEHVEAARQSGATLVSYAHEHGLSAHTMRNWRRKLKGQTDSVGAARSEARPTAFVALKVAAPAMPHGSAVTLAIGSEVRLQMNELPPPSWLAEIELAMRGSR